MMCFYSLDGTFTPPKGVRGGQGSPSPSAYKVLATGAIEELPDLVGAQQLLPGECIGSRSTGGGGYGDPFERDPAKVLADVREGYISVERARSTYGVVLVGDISRPESLRVADEQPERGAVPVRSAPRSDRPPSPRRFDAPRRAVPTAADAFRLVLEPTLSDRHRDRGVHARRSHRFCAVVRHRSQADGCEVDGHQHVRDGGVHIIDAG